MKNWFLRLAAIIVLLVPLQVLAKTKEIQVVSGFWILPIAFFLFLLFLAIIFLVAKKTKD